MKEMFTGMVQGLGKVRSLERGKLVLDTFPTLQADDPWKLGESIAVNGCCLSLVSIQDGLNFDLSQETLSRTNLGQLQTGDSVNLERALRMGDRLGGHWVQGHIDGLGKIVGLGAEGQDWILRIRVPAGYKRYLIDKGSICVDGISLTVVAPDENTFSCSIIPHTLKSTNLQGRQIGDLVNLEFDVLAKYLERQLQISTKE